MLKKIILTLIYGHRGTSDNYIKFLKKKGMKIGEGTTFFYPRDVFVDITRPWLVEIGKNVQITRNVTILTHGYDWSVLKGKYNEILGSSGAVKIGNNVFIGMNATILKGVSIGNNVIIGANSLVNKSFPDDVVVAGNPAKVIMSLEEYYKKRKDSQKEELVELILEYYKVYNNWPNRKILREFIYSYEARNKEIVNDSVFNEIMILLNNYEESLEKFFKTNGIFNSYDELIEYCKNKISSKKEIKNEKKN